MIENDKGFTLVEVLASMTILFIILISFFTIFTQSALFTRTNEESLEATNLADQVMEVLRQENTINEQVLKDTGMFIDCQPADSTMFQCQINDRLEARIEVIVDRVDLGLTPIGLNIRHRTREVGDGILATRFFYIRNY